MNGDSGTQPGREAADSSSALYPPVVIGLGSNLGDSVALLRRAMDRLDARAVEPVRRSSLWQSTPVDCPPGSPLFANAVVLLAPRPGETPVTLLDHLQAEEKEFGRQPKRVLNEPRPLDLDLIAWGREMLSTARLTLPHPRAHLRRFVLAPLAELAPDFFWPGLTKTVGQLLSEVPFDPLFRRLTQA
jgi:2-amino-4-hydroxy-6-hydroxymethyldihydropteridine diphosphokinase